MSGSINLQNETQNVYSMQVKTAASNSTTTSSLTKNSFVNTNSNNRGDYCLSLMNLTQKNKQQAMMPQHNLVKKVQLKYPVTIQRRNTNIIEYNPQPAKNYYKQQQHQSSQHKQQLHHRHQAHSRSTHRHQSFNLRRKTTGSIMGANGAPIYEDYLCDKEVESYFESNPVYFDCLKNSQKLLNFPINMLPLQQQQLHPPPPIISASLYSQHSVVTTDAPLNLLTKSNSNHNNKSVVLHKAKCFNASNFLVKPNVVRNGSVSFSSLSLASSSSSSSSNTTSSNNSVTLTKSLIGAGIVRQNQGESYC